MRVAIFLAACVVASAQTADPAYESLSRAYDSLKAKDYSAATASFLKAVDAAPKRASIRKDLGYTYLKVGENERARIQFREAMQLDPADVPVAMEYAFLCYEGKDKSEARRIFDRLRKGGNPVAETAFRNIDLPLKEGIARWEEAIQKGAGDSGAHYELAQLAEQRDQLEVAVEHYRRAWDLRPDHRMILVDLGRVLNLLGRIDQATAALVAASRAPDPRTAETGRELLAHYPYVQEFRAAISLDPQNVELRRELAYLLLQMSRDPEAEKEFRVLADTPFLDLLSSAQLGFMLYGRGERDAAKVFLDRVLGGPDKDLANRVRAVIGLPQSGHAAAAENPKQMAENSIRAGYLKDALQYLRKAYAADRSDYGVVLKLAWTSNVLHDDSEAFHWYSVARRSTDPKIAAEASRAWKNLRPTQESVSLSGWVFPLFSSRWNDLFGYGQFRTEFRTRLPIRPYLSVRFDGDAQSKSYPAWMYGQTMYSQTSVILAAGLRTLPWHGITTWVEAGTSVNYLTRHMLPDYRGGVSAAGFVGRSLNGEASGWFAETTIDGVFMSRYGNDLVGYSQSRGGYSFGGQGLRMQLGWTGGVTLDSARQHWANFAETGPGMRIRSSFMPASMYLVFNAVRGTYLIHDYDPSHRAYTDYRAGVWYSFAY